MQGTVRRGGKEDDEAERIQSTPEELHNTTRLHKEIIMLKMVRLELDGDPYQQSQGVSENMEGHAQHPDPDQSTDYTLGDITVEGLRLSWQPGNERKAGPHQRKGISREQRHTNLQETGDRGHLRIADTR